MQYLYIPTKKKTNIYFITEHKGKFKVENWQDIKIKNESQFNYEINKNLKLYSWIFYRYNEKGYIRFKDGIIKKFKKYNCIIYNQNNIHELKSLLYKFKSCILYNMNPYYFVEIFY